jgi:hypothetical protein
LHLPHLVHAPAPVVETPPAEHTSESVVETAPDIETPAAEPTPEPASNPSTPEIIEAPAETEPEPEPSSPKTSLPRKRTSTLGYIGKIFWPFGSGSESPKSTNPAPAQDEDVVSVPIAEATTVAA